VPSASPKSAPAASRSGASVNPAESPLAWLRRRKDRDGEAMISQAQFDAGERLRSEFWFRADDAAGHHELVVTGALAAAASRRYDATGGRRSAGEYRGVP
jgi:Domain of unknown function (DUF6456)